MAQTNLYAVSRNIGSSTFNNYVSAPINGPLSTNRYPGIIPYHNYGTLTGQRPTPPQFNPSQEPIYSEMNSNARAQYIRTISKQTPQQIIQGKLSTPTHYTVHSSQRIIPVSTHMNYTAPIPSSMYVNTKKSTAIGKSVYKVGLPLTAPTSTKNYYPSGTRSALRRARSSGCTAPKKKGSIYNHTYTNFTNGQGFGAIPRQNY